MTTSAFMVDMHIHTTAGSADSSLRTSVLSARASDLALDGLAVTEHLRIWTDPEAAEFVAGTELALFRGAEWSTDVGHILVFGVKEYRSEIREAAELRRYVQDHGGLMVAAHPFRHAFDSVPSLRKAYKDVDVSTEAACRHPALEWADAVEVLNGACTDQENRLAAQVAHRMGLPGIGGSDAHYAEDVGRAVTLFERPLRDERDLIEQLRQGRCRAAAGPAIRRLLAT